MSSGGAASSEAAAAEIVFVDSIAEALASLPAVQAVALGGSRASGTERADSDWDFAVYYRGVFEPRALRQFGWAGEVSEIGGWGGGVFNGGAWLTIEGRRVDVHYRDLEVVEHEVRQARAGRFHIEQLMFHLAGIPSYLVVGELANNRVLRGVLPRPEYPAALREAAPRVWADRARLTLDYARDGHAPASRLAQCAGLIAVAASQCAHAILADRGEWATNEKTLLERADLVGVDAIVAALEPEPSSLVGGVAATLALFHSRFGHERFVAA
jgi:predicted nucleotidyltransferase